MGAYRYIMEDSCSSSRVGLFVGSSPGQAGALRCNLVWVKEATPCIDRLPGRSGPEPQRDAQLCCRQRTTTMHQGQAHSRGGHRECRMPCQCCFHGMLCEHEGKPAGAQTPASCWHSRVVPGGCMWGPVMLCKGNKDLGTAQTCSSLPALSATCGRLGHSARQAHTRLLTEASHCKAQGVRCAKPYHALQKHQLMCDAAICTRHVQIRAGTSGHLLHMPACSPQAP